MQALVIELVFTLFRLTNWFSTLSRLFLPFFKDLLVSEVGQSPELSAFGKTLFERDDIGFGLRQYLRLLFVSNHKECARINGYYYIRVIHI